MEFILASGNQHKAEELAKLLNSDAVSIVSASQAIDVVEDGETYEENAFKKAEAYYQKYNCPVISDDSGLNVLALPDELGIYSARFGGKGLNDKERAYLLLEKMADKSGDDRSASFSCVLCFYVNPQEVFFFEGRVEGQISRDLRGDKGFGYDPVFIPSRHEGDSTMAMIPEWKEQHCHRSKACQHATKFFQERIGQI